MTQDRPQDGLDRVTVAEAANRLGLTQDAVRKRVARGTIRHDRDQDGRIYVYVSPSDTSSKTDQDTVQDDSEAQEHSEVNRYIASLEDQIRFLRRELERKDAILLRMAERIPELEPVQEPQNQAESAEPRSDRVETPEEPEKPPQRRSLWRRIFGG